MKRLNLRTKYLKFLFAVSALLFAIAIGIFLYIVIELNSGTYDGRNEEYYHVYAQAGIETREYGIQNCDSLELFYGKQRENKVLFLEELPFLKIVNSNEYKMKITSNSDILDMLGVNTQDGVISITLENDLTSFKGYYVHSDKFEVTVYAPIVTVATALELNAEYDVPKADTVNMLFSGELVKGKIYNVDVNRLYGVFCGSSRATIEGNVTSLTDIGAAHNSKIDASGLNTALRNATLSNQLFGLSSVEWADDIDIDLISKGTILTFLEVAFLVITALAVIYFGLRLRKRLKAKARHKQRHHS